MTGDQEAHLRWTKLRFAELVDTKYRKGVTEHGGNLWEKGSEYFIDAAIEEAVDLVTYLLTLKESLDRSKRAFRRTLEAEKANLQNREEHQ